MKLLTWFTSSAALCVALACGTLNAQEVDGPPQPLYNTYAPFQGEPFFLLSDATFGTQQNATVRLEVTNPETLEEAGGVDIRLYRINDPLTFLGKQKNLHRVQIKGGEADTGLVNGLIHVWDSWVVKARLAWRKLYSTDARQSVVKESPSLKTPEDLTKPSTFEYPVQFKPLAGLPLVEQFRYPVQKAKEIKPADDVKLEGSSSEFITPSKGNVWVSLGTQKPGLYLVEAISGQHRATTLLFVSDTVALTKVSSDQMVVWAAHRQTGQAVSQTQVVWSDGVGTLQSGLTDGQGLLRMDHKSPEQTYVFGLDPAGGAFISENFYYDSEIYAAKVYAVTDRPLYRPGDQVYVKVTGREFRNARDSVALPDGDVTLSVIDPSGQLMQTIKTRFSSTTGADAQLTLPDNAPAGGYELRLVMGDDQYNAAFRVADYQKPHFEILILPDQPEFPVGKAVSGRLQLNYPDGKPVANAQVSLSARAQKLTMIEGELDYAGQFPLKLKQDELTTDSSGIVKFDLPAADEPSRYIISVLATDGAAYRVKTSREVLIERATSSYKLTPDRQFSRPTETVNFRYVRSQRQSAKLEDPADRLPAAAASDEGKPVEWTWIRLEDRSTQKGPVDPKGQSVGLTFDKPGSYTVQLRDAKGRLVAATSHWVSGDGLKAPVGSINIVFDKRAYKPGDTAQALITFPEPVNDALLTLERDRVESAGIVGQKADWMSTERVSPLQWKVSIPVRESMSPNMTLSAAYILNGDYVFENQGLMVEQSHIALNISSPKAVYAPGEMVQIDITASRDGQIVPGAMIQAGVVDEMIYVLQPEIAPRIEDFFYHPRRDNVRTSASLSFIGYDLATSKLGKLPTNQQVNQRALKVLERPRRENVDTAAWEPRLVTDAAGKVSFRFKMPDSLTRWRITARAMDAQGHVGQLSQWVRSDKAVYAKWTSPTWQREGDQAQAAIAIFNQEPKELSLEWEISGAGVSLRSPVKVQPGANYLSVPLAANKIGSDDVTITLRRDGKVVDQLSTKIQRLPVAWRAQREQVYDLSQGIPTLQLPEDATRVRVSLSSDPAAGAINRWMEDLIDFPYGCVEQTASRMLPLSLALTTLSPSQQNLSGMLMQRLSSARLSLMQMAGPEARFGWWGRGMSNDPFLTTYAYYADWRATSALNSPLPAEHWETLYDVYAKEGVKEPLLQRALMLSWMRDMGLSVTPMVRQLMDDMEGQLPASARAKPVPVAPAAAEAASAASGGTAPVVEERVKAAPTQATKDLAQYRGSVAMAYGDLDTQDVAWIVAAPVAQASSVPVSAGQKQAIDQAAERLSTVRTPLIQALLLAAGRTTVDSVNTVLSQVRTQAPTMDRALTLMALHKALGGKVSPAAIESVTLSAPWQRGVSATGQSQWQLPSGAQRPQSLLLATGQTAGWAYVSFESAQPPQATLPVKVERSLWKVITSQVAAETKPAESSDDANKSAERVKPWPPENAGRLSVKLERVKPGSPLDTASLYVDRLELSSESDMLRWGLVEVALPPGASVESSTWGLSIDQGKESMPMPKATHENTAQGYAVPVEQLSPGEPVVIQHLVRFAQRGRFQLPATRYHRMYQPESQALSSGKAWKQMEVR